MSPIQLDLSMLLLQEHGEDMSNQDLTKQLALQWNSLPAEKKKVNPIAKVNQIYACLKST